MVEHPSIDFEQKAEVYTVYITDEKQTTSGSGVLYYGGSGDFFYVFTCAHVIEKMDNIVLKLLLRGSGDGDYDTYEITVRSSQAAYWPLDKINENGNHSHDVAVIQVHRDKRLILEKTDYFISEAERRDAVFIQGYPGGLKKGESLLSVLDVSHGKVLRNISQSKFQLRIEDLFADQGQRVFETEGFSGAGVWKADEDIMCLSGILESASRETAYRSKYYAARMDMIQSIMKNHFETPLESKIVGIPESDVADINEDICYNGTVHVVGNIAVNDLWLQEKTEKVRAFIDELQMQSAIDLAVDILKDDKFEECSNDKKKLLLQHLLYCYEICYLDKEYHETEKQMREYGFIQEHDELRWMTSQFGRHNFEKVIAYSQKYIHEHSGEKNSKYVIAQMFLTISKAYTEDLPTEKTIRKFLDDREALVVAIEDKEAESLVYQMLGYVYGEHYKQYEKSVRCLNRAYRLGNDKVVLETLAEAYYFLALKNAVRVDGTVNADRIDIGSLYKARECYLVILDRADELFLSGLIRRAGVVLYNTFFFLMDQYRVVTFYPLLRKYLPENLAQQELRDIELKHAKIICQSGYINLDEYAALNEKDKRCLAVMTQAENCLRSIDVFVPERQVKNPLIEQKLKDIIYLTENSIEEMDEKDSAAVRSLLMNLYGRGITLFSWNAVDEMRRHLPYIVKSGDRDLMVCMENFLFEYEHSFEEAESRFIDALNKIPGLKMWHELLNFYKRCGRFDKADAIFTDLFENHFEWIEENQEYAYRGYFDYITMYQRDIKEALRCYLTNKEKLLDADIAGFWELELMFCTNSFNRPERYEKERLKFCEKGLIAEPEYHRTAFIAYMVNLNAEKAKEHNIFLNGDDLPVIFREKQILLPPEEIKYLVWQGKLVPQDNPAWKGMVPEQLEITLSKLAKEEWKRPVDEIIKSRRLAIDRNIAIDAWGLYILAVSGNLEVLGKFDNVYVTHFTITRLLDEITQYHNVPVRNALEFLEKTNHVQILSAGFEYQLKVRDKTRYDEPAGTIAIAEEKMCIAVLGEPLLEHEMIEAYKNIIVRITDMQQVVGAMLDV